MSKDLILIRKGVFFYEFQSLGNKRRFEKMDEAGERVPLVDGKVTIATRYAYALGHIFNDLAAAMWFSYTLLFLQRISLIQPVVAGSLLLLGSY